MFELVEIPKVQAPGNGVILSEAKDLRVQRIAPQRGPHVTEILRFASNELRVTANLINRNFQIVLVKDFKRQDYSLNYYEVFTNNIDQLGAINTSGYALFTISTENYIELFKNKETDSYQRWFEKVYLEGGE